jgi:hypothetical protein
LLSIWYVQSLATACFCRGDLLHLEASWEQLSDAWTVWILHDDDIDLGKQWVTASYLNQCKIDSMNWVFSLVQLFFWLTIGWKKEEEK